MQVPTYINIIYKPVCVDITQFCSTAVYTVDKTVEGYLEAMRFVEALCNYLSSKSRYRGVRNDHTKDSGTLIKRTEFLLFTQTECMPLETRQHYKPNYINFRSEKT